MCFTCGRAVAALALVFAVVAAVGVARQILVNVGMDGQTTAGWTFTYSSEHGIAYCSIPKAASSTLTAYLTGIAHGASNFSQAEQFIINHGGDNHFAFRQKAGYTQLKAQGRPFKFFTVVRHPGTRLYSSWFDKIHAHRGGDQPEMLYDFCGGNPACTFEAFVDGVVRFLGSGRPMNPHVDLQSRLCGTSQYDFDRVFKIENGFDSVARQLETWSGVHFNFTSPSGEEGYSHHTKEATGVYHDFPVEDMDAYERLMPYGLQMKIYRAYKRDFNMFGYPAPVWRDTQLVSCPKLPFVQGMKNTQWKKEDLKVVRRRNLV